MLRCALILSILISCYSGNGQINLVHVKTHNLKSEQFKVDHLGNIYTIIGSTLTKLDIQKGTNTTYTNSTSETISNIDVSDPLRMLMYFQDQNQILFLNQQLAAISNEIYFDDLEIYEVPALCNTSQNRFWLFDQQNFRLIQIDRELNIVQKGNSLMSILNKADFPSSLIHAANYLYLNIPSKGILVFDQFGSYLKNIPIINARSISIAGDALLFIDSKDEIKLYSFSNFDQTNIILQESIEVISVQLINNQFYISDGQKIYQYTFEK